MTAPALLIDRVGKSYASRDGATRVLTDVSLRLDDGHTLALTGESGSGKSTLLQLIAGLDRADSGRIMVAGQDVTAMTEAETARLRRHDVAMVFQHYNLIPSMTVGDNLAFHARLAGRLDAGATPPSDIELAKRN